MKLSDQQWRVLTYLAGQTKWMTLPELARLVSLNRGDSECVGSLADLNLVELATGLRVRLSPAGQVVATEARET